MGNVAEGGLVDCNSTEEFDVALDNAMKNWKSLHENGAKFCGYFVKEKADVIRNCCTADIRSVYGLGFPPKVYTQNASECINRLVKAEDVSKYGKKAIGLPLAIERIRTEIRRQHKQQFLAVINRGEYQLAVELSHLGVEHKEQFLAVINRGEYQLAVELSHLGVEEKDFFRMSDPQKNSVKKKFFSASMSDARSDLTTQKEKNGDTQCTLSVTPERAQIIEIPFPVLHGMFEKAATMVKDKSAVWRIPAQENDVTVRFMVHSKTTRNPPQVQVNVKSGKAQCDKDSVNWASYSMCSHTLAAAETGESLKSSFIGSKGGSGLQNFRQFPT